jgi:chemotaxis protein histidine kinase CheA
MDGMEGRKTLAADAEDNLLTLARELTSLRAESAADPETVERIALGLHRLSDLARDCGQLRVSKACKALSTILVRMDQGREEDASFILSTALNFLDAIQAKRISVGRKA